MIETFFGQNTLDTGQAFLWAFLIGGVFGVALEQAGFGSSRRLAGIFYFRDMSVLRTMFTALLVGMLGLIDRDQQLLDRVGRRGYPSERMSRSPIRPTSTPSSMTAM